MTFDRRSCVAVDHSMTVGVFTVRSSIPEQTFRMRDAGGDVKSCVAMYNCSEGSSLRAS
jgi:hypothetical protein